MCYVCVCDKKYTVHQITFLRPSPPFRRFYLFFFFTHTLGKHSGKIHWENTLVLYIVFSECMFPYRKAIELAVSGSLKPSVPRMGKGGWALLPRGQAVSCTRDNTLGKTLRENTLGKTLRKGKYNRQQATRNTQPATRYTQTVTRNPPHATRNV